MAKNPVVHFEVIGNDPNKLQAFYRDAFAWEIQTIEEMNYGLVSAPQDKSGIGGGIGGHPPGEHASFVTFYVQVDDLQATLARIEKLGGKTLVPPTTIPDMVTFAQFADPEGHRVGLVKREEGSP